MQQAAGYTVNSTFHAMYPTVFKSTTAADALVNLAQATEADCTIIANLASINTNLTTEVVHLKSKLAAKYKDITTL
eukprot:7578146-Ditylum_brightwellii.AAC.3